jgi:DNA-directed RNA polymerase specialized sigma24 family protein
MNKNENNVKRIYDKLTKTWFEVSPEQYEKFDRWRTNLRKREQYHHRCMCPRSKWWLCDGMCQDCEFHAPGDNLSLDLTYQNSEGEEFSMLDKLADPAESIEDIVTDQIVLDMLFQRLTEIMPEARHIGDLRMSGLSDAEIADKIGVPRTTFLSRLKKAKELLQREYPDLF